MPAMTLSQGTLVVFGWSLPERSAARQNVVEIACACGSVVHTVLTLLVTPRLFHCWDGGLSLTHSVGRPPWHCMTTRKSFFRVDTSYFSRLLSVAPHCSCHFTTRASVGFHMRGEDGILKCNCCKSVGGYSRAGGDRDCVAGP